MAVDEPVRGVLLSAAIAGLGLIGFGMRAALMEVEEPVRGVLLSGAIACLGLTAGRGDACAERNPSEPSANTFVIDVETGAGSAAGSFLRRSGTVGVAGDRGSCSDCAGVVKVSPRSFSGAVLSRISRMSFSGAVLSRISSTSLSGSVLSRSSMAVLLTVF